MNSNRNHIVMFLHCALCLREKPADQTPAEFARLNTGWTTDGLQVWCERHNCNVMHVDFEGHKHPADLSIPKDLHVWDKTHVGLYYTTYKCAKCNMRFVESTDASNTKPDRGCKPRPNLKTVP